MSTNPGVMVSHLHIARMTPYSARCSGSPHEVWALYTWNAQLSSAFQEVLAFVEVSLRNAVDPHLRTWNRGQSGKDTWLKNPAAPLDLLVTQKTTNDLKKQADSARRRRHANHPRKTAQINHDDYLANTSFGFWRGMFPDLANQTSSSQHRQAIYAATSSIWRDALTNGFPNLRNDPYGHATGDRVRRLHSLRNRVSHMENLLDVDIDDRLRDAVQLVNAIKPELRDWLEEANRVRHVASMRPHP